MASFYAQTSHMRQNGRALYEIKRKLQSIAAELQNTQLRLGASLSSRAQIGAKIASASRTVYRQADAAVSLQSALLQTCDAYEKTEKQLAGVQQSGSAKWAELSLGILSKFGYVGKAGSAVISLFHNGLADAKGVSDSAGKLAESVAEVVEDAKKPDQLKRLFGLNAYNSNPSTAPRWLDRCVDNFKDKFADEMDLSKASNAISLIGTAVGCTIGNIEEMNRGEITAGRAVMETVTETALTFVGAAAVKTAVGAAIVAFAPAAPAVVVGLAAMGAVALIDTAFEHFTGKGAVEFFSDKIVDGVESAGKALSQAVGNAAQTVSNVFGGWKRALGFG